MKVLIVEDDRQVAESTRAFLAKASFDVEVCHDGESGLEQARSSPVDLVVLDLSLPGIDGVEVCRRLRTFSDAYVVMLTGLDTETDRLIGLSVGADDYMTKPFSPRELVARIRAMQRRPRGEDDPPGPIRKFGDLRIDPGTREVTISDRTVALSRTEYELLESLSRKPRLTLSRRQLLEAVWGEEWFGDDHVIDVHVSNLRRKLGDSSGESRYIVTARGYGYRMGAG